MGSNKLSQSELEQPAKVYQLVSVEDKLDKALEKLDQVASQTSNNMTVAQFAVEKSAMEKDFDEKISNAVEAIHLEYRPVKRGAIWFASIVVAALVGVAVTTFAALQKLVK